MRKNASAVATIGGTDGPTSVFVIKRNQKLTWKQKLQKFRNRLKRAYVAKTLTTESHTMDEVMEYVVNNLGFVELDTDEVAEEYNQLRASFLMQHAPELLGEYADMPKLKSESPEDIQTHIKRFQERQQKAMEVPVTEFDIEFHKYKLPFDDENNDMHIIIEKKYAYIGGGSSGSKRILKNSTGYIKVCTGITASQKRISRIKLKDIMM